MSVNHFLLNSKLVFMVKCIFLTPSLINGCWSHMGQVANLGQNEMSYFSLSTSTKSAPVFDTFDISLSHLHWGLPKNNIYQNLTLGSQSCQRSCTQHARKWAYAEKYQCFASMTEHISLNIPDIWTKPWYEAVSEPALSESDNWLPFLWTQLAQQASTARRMQ